MALDGRLFVVGNAGANAVVVKQPSDKFKLYFDFSKWLDSGDTVTSVSAMSFTPTDGTNAPTSAAGAISGGGVTVSYLVDAGLPAWNTTGTGKMTFTATTTNGEKKQVDINTTIQDF